MGKENGGWHIGAEGAKSAEKLSLKRRVFIDLFGFADLARPNIKKRKRSSSKKSTRLKQKVVPLTKKKQKVVPGSYE